MYLYYSGNPEDYPFKDTQAGRTVMETFFSHGIVAFKQTREPCLTVKGKAWVAAILATPYPRTKIIWVDSRTNEPLDAR